jgi:AcrR family transcriptional regulator
MSRTAPPDRLDRLVDAATAVFVEQGYRRTQMADVAEALGVAKGTLYLSVESKEALFDLLLRTADGPRPIRAPGPLPLRTPRAGSTLRYVREQLAAGADLPALARALARARPAAETGQELRDVLEEIYAVLAAHRHGIKLVDRSARDLPELAALWFEGSRGGLVGLLGQYLRPRIARRALRAVPDVDAAARWIVETLAWWAVHRHWDTHPQAISDATARATAVTFLLNALVPEARSR